MDPPPVVSGVPRPPPRSRTSSNNSLLDEINDSNTISAASVASMASMASMELARISNFLLAVVDAVIRTVLAVAVALQPKVNVGNGRCELPTISGCLATTPARELQAVTAC